MKSRTAGGWSTGGRSSTSESAYSACSRAEPPPVKYDCSVCAASWITRSPSILPGHPRSRRSSFGVNMHSFTAPHLNDEGPAGSGPFAWWWEVVLVLGVGDVALELLPQ